MLGTVEVVDESVPIKLPRRQERSLLAVLLLRANESVPVAELVDLLWPEDPPAEARNAIQVYISRLRKAGVPITGGGAGYAVQVDPEAIDVVRFRRLVAEAKTMKDPVLRGARLREALQLWRGDALADVTPEVVRNRLRAGLDEERRAAIEDRVEADLEAGRHAELLPELAELVEADPLRERLVIAWMTAFYRAGRKTEALAAYGTLADRLVEEFGLDPAPALRRLHLAIVRDDPSLRLGAGRRAEVGSPRELPVDISLLMGRDDTLADAVRVLKADRDEAAVYCLWGGAGVGKSAVATKVAHLVAESFPDGQLFARLQDVGGAAVPARTLLGRMLRSLGVEPRAVPDETADRARMFREETADKAVLVLLDDALDPWIVTELLPSGSRSAAIVTSRKPLPELAPAVHRQVVPLDLATSRSLLTKLIGRSLRDQMAVEAVAGDCGGLPLALRILGSRLALSGDEALQTLTMALADDNQRLDSMVAGDLAVRTSLGRSLSLADPQARRLLARLSLVGVAEFPVWVAAPLLDCDEASGAAAFDRLVELGLVELVAWEPSRRYKMHDLVRSYAAEQLAAAGDADRPRRRYLDAVHRVTALADTSLNHGLTLSESLELPARAGLPAVEAMITDEAKAWFDDAWPLVCAAVHSALDLGEAELAALIGLRVNAYLVMRELDEVRIDVLEPISAAVEEKGLLALYVRTRFAVMPAYHPTGTFQVEEGARLLELAEQIGDADLQARSLYTISHGARTVNELDRDLEACLRAIEILDRSNGSRGLRASILQNLAHNYAERHDYESAERWALRSVEFCEPGTGSEAMRSVILGEIQYELGKLEAADTTLAGSVAIFETLGADYYRTMALCVSARVSFRRGRIDEGRTRLELAKSLFSQQPTKAVRLHVAVAEAELAMETGDYETGRRLRRELIQAGVEYGDKRLQLEQQHALDNDPRDPANRG